MKKDRDFEIEFPCDFPIKIFGLTHQDFETAVLTIINKHVPNLPEGSLQVRASKQGKYSAMTVTIPATSQQQLDAIYSDLSACEYVLMAI